MSESLLEVRNLRKRYGKLLALAGVSFTIPRGAVFGLIGPNGAGKTTALRIIASVLEPDEGEIFLDGRPVNGDKAYWAGRIGFMPDFFGVYPDLMTWEYLDFFARAYSIPAAERSAIIDRLLELVELSGKKNSYVQDLSRGMQQRLCLAHALVHDPDLLLLDEPASGLDPRARVAFRQLVKRLQGLGKTVLISSHILLELAEICDQVAILEKGELVAVGDVDAIGQTLLPTRRLLLRALSNLPALQKALVAEPNVLAVREVAGALQVDFAGEEADVADLIHRLVSAGFPLVSFSEAETDLEEVYMSLTKGETQ